MYFHCKDKASRAGEFNKDNYAWQGLNLGQWYRIKIRVRKSRFECYLDNKLMFDESCASLSHGRIGLNMDRIQARFRHIKVTDPEGKVLYEGLGDLAKAIAASGFSDSRGAGAGIAAAESAGKRPTPPVEKIGRVSLFNGKDLTGWSDTIKNGSKWQVVNRLLEGHGGGRGKPAVLVSQRQNLADFRLRAEVRYPANGAGWVEVRRSEASGKSSAYPVVDGVQSAHGIPFGGVTKATAFEYGKGLGWDFRAEPIPLDPNAWNNWEITVSDNRIVTKVNGTTLSEYTDVKRSYPSGGIALFCQGDSVVQYRSIMIEDLSEATGTGNPPTSAVNKTTALPPRR
jgi:hypothetical protein